MDVPKGERGRTLGQLRAFADHVEAGEWVEASIDTAQPERQPIPKVDLRENEYRSRTSCSFWRF